MGKRFNNKTRSLFRPHMGSTEFRLLERCPDRIQILLFSMYYCEGTQY